MSLVTCQLLLGTESTKVVAAVPCTEHGLSGSGRDGRRIFTAALRAKVSIAAYLCFELLTVAARLTFRSSLVLSNLLPAHSTFCST
ncbi:hypothetical protein PsYK624_104730 [Phanerochaete sordida]|uniref:Uncharacterized protein n=1 Tax=Phanerochaete sordida TaxID=48140 RepID=A0A9P3GHB9_9APHY|nr:hypothetical protein PsYK624_104730 [Phanerochaete sordida]